MFAKKQLHPTIRNIVAVVRLKGRRGCTAEYLARTCGETPLAIKAALKLQLDAGVVESFEYASEPGVAYYRVREGA